ncbi:MAG: thioredoxin domain-containing protein [Crocinitomicaceae bacterium]|nr:thioredoxin domain-containing protein [Crocinitomicaceae bacterium]
MKKVNALMQESSPYLLQHADNPVDWVAWSEAAFERAKQENKLVLVSIGYSSCHWCHVMEHECFEDEEVAKIMNEYFINIKVDREERPDVDQVYMTAVQLMTQSGGWPLNCFTLPDGRPIYGGTYFPKEQWINVLKSLHHTFTNEKERTEEYAKLLHEGIVSSELIATPNNHPAFDNEKLHELVMRWKRQFDTSEGGDARAPKFPMPNNYQFLLQYGMQFSDERVLKHVELTLDKMAMGGIYDHVGGGFTRYSTDLLWKVPHFEKMLYDNAQLISLYSQAYKVFKKPLYERVVHQTIEWLQREMQDFDGVYHAGIDADSQGVEGLYYCWTLEEYKDALHEEYDFAADLYSFNARGHWEDGKYIPLRTSTDSELQNKYQLSAEELATKIAKVNEALLQTRKRRVRPSIDDKCLTSWNALLLSGLSDAYAAFHIEEYKYLALKIARWLLKYQVKEDHSLWRTRKYDKSTVDGFLEDYATVIQAFIKFYEVTGLEEYAIKAAKLTDYAREHFQNKESKMFYFTPDSTQLIARKMEISDNVIPASNSIMANNLHQLGFLFERSEWIQDARQQLANIYDNMDQYGSMYSNWGILLLNTCNPFFEVVLTGNTEKNAANWHKGYHPNTLIAYQSDEIPLGKGKAGKEDLFFICNEQSGCFAPISELDEALKLIKL